MTTAPTEAPPALKKEEPLRPEDRPRVDLLYERCAQAPQGTIFFQRELSNMAVADTLTELTTLLQELVDRHLMKLMMFENEPCWQLRPKEDAEKLRKLTPDERLLYHHIDQAQKDGIWSKALRARTNFTPQALTKCIKSLESKELVQSVMSVKFPSRKMYLLAHLQPSEDIAGGPWQTDGEYDMALIEAVSKMVEKLMHSQTCIEVPVGYNDYRGQDIEEAPAVKPYRAPITQSRLVPRHQPKYPTAASLRDTIVRSGVIKDKVIHENDMEQLLEMMVLEGRLEKVSGTNYRLAMQANEPEGLNGFVDAPCGTCPVFELCGDSGEISARTCVYFGEWLGTESEFVK